MLFGKDKKVRTFLKKGVAKISGSGILIIVAFRQQLVGVVERQTRKLEVLVPVTGVRVQIPPPTPEFRKRLTGRFFATYSNS